MAKKSKKYQLIHTYSQYGYLLKAFDELIPKMYILSGFGLILNYRKRLRATAAVKPEIWT